MKLPKYVSLDEVQEDCIELRIRDRTHLREAKAHLAAMELARLQRVGEEG